MNTVLQVANETIGNIDSGQTAQAALAQTGLCGQERQICSDLVYGLLRTRLRIQTEIAKYLKNPRKLPKPMLRAIELALYAQLFQDRAQIEIVGNDTIAFIKKRFGQKMANVANAVLRTASRQSCAGPPPANYEDWAAWHAIPAAISSLWLNAYGEEIARNLVTRSSQRPYAALRIHPAYLDSLNSELAQNPDAIRLETACFAFPPGKLPRAIGGKPLSQWQNMGAVSFQAAGSQMALHKLQIYTAWKEEPVWDACSGIGGKTTALLEQNIDVRLASDVNFSRLTLLKEECKRLALPTPAIAQINAAHPALNSWHGHILADLPCSGLGVLARRPDIKARFDPALLPKLYHLQHTIIQALAQALPKNRELAIITCTLNPKENEALRDSLTSQGLALIQEWQTPHTHPWLEGMYGARLRKI